MVVLPAGTVTVTMGDQLDTSVTCEGVVRDYLQTSDQLAFKPSFHFAFRGHPYPSTYLSPGEGVFTVGLRFSAPNGAPKVLIVTIADCYRFSFVEPDTAENICRDFEKKEACGVSEDKARLSLEFVSKRIASCFKYTVNDQLTPVYGVK